MSKIPYLFRRGNIFYFRLAVPIVLRDQLQCREIILSLKTKNRHDAVPMALGLAADVIKLFNDAKIMKDMTHKRQIWALREKLKVKELLHQEELEQRELGQLSAIRRTQFETALKTENEALKEILTRGAGKSDSPITEQSKSNSPLLSSVIEDFLKQYDPQKRDMLKKHKANLPVLLELVGDTQVDQIKHIDISRFVAELCKLPKDRTRFKEMTFRQMIAANTGDCIHKGAFTNYKSSVSQLINFAKEQHEDAFENVSMAALKYKGNRSESESKQRSFKIEELEKLFNCKDMLAASSNSRQVHKFWLPVIGLFTGMRVNEICQLNPSKDIKQDSDGIWYFWINEDTESADDVTKSVKTDAGIRVVPIHSKLIELGLLDYVAALKIHNHKVLFPQWKAKDDKAGGNAAREIRRLIELIGLRDETKGAKLTGMHAFRKNVLTAAHKGGFLADMLSIVGHEDNIRDENGNTIPDQTKVYIDSEALAVPLSAKKFTIEKLVFDINLHKPAKPIF